MTVKSYLLSDPERLARSVLGLVMLSFDGQVAPAAMLERLRSAPAAGVTL